MQDDLESDLLFVADGANHRIQVRPFTIECVLLLQRGGERERERESNRVRESESHVCVCVRVCVCVCV